MRILHSAESTVYVILTGDDVVYPLFFEVNVILLVDDMELLLFPLL